MADERIFLITDEPDPFITIFDFDLEKGIGRHRDLVITDPAIPEIPARWSFPPDQELRPQHVAAFLGSIGSGIFQAILTLKFSSLSDFEAHGFRVFELGTGGALLDPVTSIPIGSLPPTPGDDVLDLGLYPQPNPVDAGAGDDFVRGSANEDEIYAGRGDDTILGQDGADSIFGNGGADVLSGDTRMLNGYLAELWVTLTETLDLSDVDNRAALATLAEKGADGSTPTGTKPLMYFTGDPATWHLNKGSTGGLGEVGELTLAPEQP